MIRTWRWLFLAAALLAGCAQGIAELQPPEIHYGQDLCAECNMIISDPRFAAAYAHEISPGRYEQLAFDDVGNMLHHASKHPEHQIAGWYVHDYRTEEWLDATAAYYVVGGAIQTPMGYGIAACADQQEAQKMAAEIGGEVLTWETLHDREWTASHQHSSDPGHR
jgi:copper chaperone NosL